jgi:hypothetical protein
MPTSRRVSAPFLLKMKDDMDPELIRRCAEELLRPHDALQRAYDAVEDQEEGWLESQRGWHATRGIGLSVPGGHHRIRSESARPSLACCRKNQRRRGAERYERRRRLANVRSGGKQRIRSVT